ncbi:non-ribosomal peptide synthetase [Nostoc sp. FACHB-888]|uniref:non-ribosomal peptide synthetase n=1 Tax=Nostoc sp. FACHB-888 TaxID=2692842 RepID=UPI001682CB1F|nr:non-ribosomal peptide synthetase [Nostoc sp. FACHB-888]MBD2245043.1 amino acid adenylation domain-containing protein [Nostoc sp. FACHB-888]
MKTIDQFLAYIDSLDIKLRVDGDRLYCNAPQGTLTPELSAELRERKIEILKFLSAANLTSNSVTIKPIPRDINLPLSFAQQRLWFLNQFDPNDPSYNLSFALRLVGTLNIAALKQSLNEIVQRHEVLRTTFTVIEQQPVQVIAPSLTLQLPVINLQQITPAQQQAEVLRLAAQEAKLPFDLIQGPLLRFTLLHLSEQEYVALLTMHHIISDGWSLDILIQELTALYEAFSQGQPSLQDAKRLPELPIQYADFGAWQRQWLAGEVLESQLAYWRKQLQGAPTVLELPTDYPRPAIQSFQGATHRFELSAELSVALKQLSQQEGATLFMTLLAAFKTLLYRYTTSTDIVIGSPIANRNHSEIEKLIGFFVNTLVLRTNLEGDPSFRELLCRVREVALGAYAYQDVPFEQLVEQLQPQRNLSHSPLFQVMFVLQNAQRTQIKLPGLSLSSLESESGTAKFDLTLEMSETASGMVGSLEYNTDLFAADTIRRMAGHLQTLLCGIVVNPEQRLSQLPLLTKDEQRQLLEKWNDIQAEYPQDKCIHQLFEAQVEKTPDAVAAVYENQYLTYQELNYRANQLAHYLQKLGVEPEVRVGICVERSLEMIIGVLGILKAGGAYVPLDPQLPQERLTFMVQDAQVSVLLTHTQLLQNLPVLPIKLVYIDKDWESITLLSQSNPAITQLHPDNIAYIIYTSGSTGQSKGVMIQHLSLVNAYFGWEKIYQLSTKATSHLQMASFSFDVFSGDLIRSLCSGGKLVLCSKDLLLSPEQLYELMEQEKVDCAEFVPAVLRNLIHYLDSSQQRLDFMRLLICGSDSWSGAEYRNFLRFCSFQTRLINSYGLTEATIDSSYFETPVKNLELNKLVAIGQPFPNTKLYILDKNLQPLPIGVPGELYISGVSLARGYSHRPDLTAEKFIPNPFSNQAGERLYKTGDIVRYSSDGNIEFIKRIDHQVKIRGFRIELGEIEAKLVQHSVVQESIVVVREDNPGNKRLVAYIVPNTHNVELKNNSELIPQLRQFLKESLPEYMVPAAFVLLEKLPLTPNGKIDRKALPIPDLTQLMPESDLVAPVTPVQEMLAGIWTQVLGLEKLGVNDNFFELGGHSLLATRVISQIRQAFKVELPLRRLFESPTVAELAKDVQTAINTGKGLELPPMNRVLREQDLPLSFAQQRLWLLDQLDPGNHTYNDPTSVRLTGLLNITALEQSLNAVVSRHETLRTVFTTVEGQPVQKIQPITDITIPIVDLRGNERSLQQRETEAKRLALAEAQRPFNLAQGPLLRATLLQLDEAEYILLLTMHHIISDLWSMAILIRELADFYAAFSQGKSLTLPDLPIQYADFAVWQREWMQGKVLETQLAYWKQRLQGAPRKLELPTDKPRPLQPTYTGTTQLFQLPKDLSDALQLLSKREDVTLSMTLLTTFNVLLYYYTKQEDIVVGSPIANRNRSEIEGLIGFFVNSLVLRTDLSGNPTFTELLRRTREVTLGAYAHQDLPFEKLVGELQLERDLNYNPLFQVWFTLQNIATPDIQKLTLSLPDLTLSPFETNKQRSPFDLGLLVSEQTEGISGCFEYKTDLFEPSTIVRMTEHLETLLQCVVTQPDIQLNQLIEKLKESDYQQQLTQGKEYKNTIRQKLMKIKQKSNINSNS